MGRSRVLTDEQRIENLKNRSIKTITIAVDDKLLTKIEKFSTQYKSRNKAITDLIKTHPEFVKMFPKQPVVNIKSRLFIE